MPHKSIIPFYNTIHMKTVKNLALVAMMTFGMSSLAFAHGGKECCKDKAATSKECKKGSKECKKAKKCCSKDKAAAESQAK